MAAKLICDAAGILLQRSSRVLFGDDEASHGP